MSNFKYSKRPVGTISNLRVKTPIKLPVQSGALYDRIDEDYVFTLFTGLGSRIKDIQVENTGVIGKSSARGYFDRGVAFSKEELNKLEEKFRKDFKFKTIDLVAGYDNYGFYLYFANYI